MTDTSQTTLSNSQMFLEAFPGPAGIVSLSGTIIMTNSELQAYGITVGDNALNIAPSGLLEQISQIIMDLNTAKERGGRTKLYREIEYGDCFYAVYTALIDGSVIFYVHDQTDLRQSTTTLVRDASIDPLTGLLNRRRFIKDVAAYTVKPGSQPFLLFFDIDHFKKVNDTYGHDAGDDILRYVANTARQTIRVSDILARAGGEEFLVYGSCREGGDAMQLAERLRTSIESKAPRVAQRKSNGEITEIRVPVTISIGYDIGIKPINELITNSDIALYVSKETGRNRVTRYTKGMIKKSK